MKYIASNQRISTSLGFLTPSEIKEDFVLCGYLKPINAKNLKLENSQKCFKITLQNGMTYTGYPESSLVTKHAAIPCKDIKIDDLIGIQYHDKFSLFGNLDMEGNAASLGLEEEMTCSLEEQKIIEEWQIGKTFNSDNELMEAMAKDKVLDNIKWKKKVRHVKLEEKVPDWLWTCNKKTHEAYIRSLFSENSNYTSRKGKKVQFLISENLSFLQDIQLLLTNMGLNYFIKGNRLIVDFDFRKISYKVVKVETEEREIYSFFTDNDYWICNGVVVK